MKIRSGLQQLDQADVATFLALPLFFYVDFVGPYCSKCCWRDMSFDATNVQSNLHDLTRSLLTFRSIVTSPMLPFHYEQVDHH